MMILPSDCERHDYIIALFKREFGLCQFKEKELKKLVKISKGYSYAELEHVFALAIQNQATKDKNADFFKELHLENGQSFYQASKSGKECENKKFADLPENSLRGQHLPFESLLYHFHQERSKMFIDKNEIEIFSYNYEYGIKFTTPQQDHNSRRTGSVCVIS